MDVTVFFGQQYLKHHEVYFLKICLPTLENIYRPERKKTTLLQKIHNNSFKGEHDRRKYLVPTSFISFPIHLLKNTEERVGRTVKQTLKTQPT